MRIYISGPMTGYVDYNKQAFCNAFKMLAPHAVSPHNVTLKEGSEWEVYLKQDIALLLVCDAICMLPGWKGSRGAVLEYDIAKRLGYTVFESVEAAVDAVGG